MNDRTMKLLFSIFGLLLAVTPFAVADQKWEKSCVIQVRPPFDPTKQKDQAPKANFAGTIKALTSDQTLREVAKSLGVPNEEAKAIVADFKSKITAKHREGTDLIEITAVDTNPKLAAMLANKVADVYIDLAKKTAEPKTKEALAALDQELAQQADLVASLRKKLDVIAKAPKPDSSKSKKPAPKADSHHDTLKKLKEAKPDLKFRTAAAIKLQDNPVSPLYQKYLHALEDLENLRSAYRGKHPKMIEAKKRVKELRQQTNKAVEQLITKLEKAPASPPHKGRVQWIPPSPEFVAAREDYEEAKDMLDAMKVKQQEQRVLLKMPRPAATIHERAK